MSDGEVFVGAAGVSAFHESVARSLVPQRLRPAPGRFEARVRARAVGGIGVVDVTCTPLTSARAAASDEDDGTAFLLLGLRGTGCLTHAHGTAVVAPGRAVVVPRGADFDVRYPDGAHLVFLALPPGRVPAPRRGHGVRDVDLEPASRAVARTIPLLCEAAAVAGPGSASDVAARSLLRGAVELVLGAAPSGEPLRAVAERLMDVHLADPRLDAAALATLLGVSTRTLHRAFAGSAAGVAGTLRSKRVGRAAQLLAASPERRLTDVAHAVGFGSASAFSAAFREGTAETPSRARARARQARGS